MENEDIRETWFTLEYVASDDPSVPPLFCGSFKSERRMDRRLKQLLKEHGKEKEGFTGRQYDYNAKTGVYDCKIIYAYSPESKDEPVSTAEKEDAPALYILQYVADLEDTDEDDTVNAIVEVCGTFEQAIDKFKEYAEEHDLEPEDVEAFSCVEYCYNAKEKTWEYVDTWDLSDAVLGEDSSEDDASSDSNSE